MYGRREELPPFSEFERELWVAVFVYALGGWLGMHRFYLGKWKTGLLYMCTFGLVGFGWIADGFQLKKMLEEENQRLRALYREQPHLFANPHATWAPSSHQRPTLWGLLSQAFFFMFAPGFFAYLCFKHQHISLMLLMFFLLILGYMGITVNSLRRMFPGVLNIPGLGGILKRLVSLNVFYLDHQPGRISYYLFYPITAPIMMIRSTSARQELKMLLFWLGTIAIFTLGEIYLFYFDAFPPHLKLLDAWDLLLFEISTVYIMFFCCILPTVALQQKAHHTGQTGVFRSIIVLGLLSFGTIIGVFKDAKTTRPVLPVFEQKLLDKKLSKPFFQAAFWKANKRLARDLRTHLDLPPTSRPTTRTTATKKNTWRSRYNRELEDFMDQAEARGFALYSTGTKHAQWTGVLLDFYLNSPRWLALYSPQKGWLTRWKQVPPDLRKWMRDIQLKIMYPSLARSPEHAKTLETSSVPKGLFYDRYKQTAPPPSTTPLHQKMSSLRGKWSCQTHTMPTKSGILLRITENEPPSYTLTYKEPTPSGSHATWSIRWDTHRARLAATFQNKRGSRGVGWSKDGKVWEFTLKTKTRKRLPLRFVFSPRTWLQETLTFSLYGKKQTGAWLRLNHWTCKK